MKQVFLPSEWNGDMTHQLRRDHVPSSVTLNGANVRRGSSCKIETELKCFPSKYNQAIENQKRCVLLILAPRVAASPPSISNELHHQFLDPFGANFMTSFEMLQSKVCPLNFSMAGMSFHFLSSVGIKSSEWSPIGFDCVFGCDARVASVLNNIACGFPTPFSFAHS